MAAAIAASLALMLPMATPPNALVYGTGYIKISDMIKVRFILEIMGRIFVLMTLLILGDWLFGIIIM